MENSENRDLTMAGVTDQSTFFELQKARNPSKYWGFWCRKWDSNPHGGLAQRILSPPRLPIPSFRQICCFKIVSSEIGGRFGGRFWKIAAMQFSKSPKLLGFLDLKRRSARLILSPARLPIPSFRRMGYCTTGAGGWQEISCRKGQKKGTRGRLDSILGGLV